ncbi:MAG TPA: hypothetical protein VLH38_02445 [Patescibacteria group bacterium]|nr:hypothetical protein [Patescibacteria group bacterium]
MPTITTFTELEKVLLQLKPNKTNSTAKTPEVMLRLMEFLGNPQESYRTIHVAGTSGKTSAAYYAAALLKAAGKRVGLSVSPHVDTVNERTQLDLQPLPQAEFCAEFGEFLDVIKPSGIVPTYFEAFTAFAFWEFARQKVDYAVMEVGIGGLLDPTNVISRPDKVCIITDIGYGHVRILGHTLAAIAAQKAGIIQEQNQVFCHVQDEGIIQAIHARAQVKHAIVHEVEESADLAFLPLFQRRNFILSEAAIRFVLQRDGLPPLLLEAITQAARTYIPARMELHTLGGKTVILDAAHNTQKVQGLVRSLRAQFPDKSIAVLFALVRSHPKFIARMVQELTPLHPYVIVTGFPVDWSGRFGSADPSAVLSAVEKELSGSEGSEVISDPAEAFAALRARPEDVLVVTGTFYLLNHIRPLLEH